MCFVMPLWCDFDALHFQICSPVFILGIAMGSCETWLPSCIILVYLLCPGLGRRELPYHLRLNLIPCQEIELNKKLLEKADEHPDDEHPDDEHPDEHLRTSRGNTENKLTSHSFYEILTES
ncbi:hypothetical protein RRG08_048086 [Elysia crispata]|uniref:Uncharacterized protein n=1 Tax=Elysia crispata TaxID=231223 RepID=A0AAE1B4F4_9GAST|nr:hypothetical protein RRG08_048086 [Elysia crispata]